MECQPQQTVTVTVNGEARTIPAGATLGDLIADLNLEPDRVAVELNRRIVRRAEWGTRTLDPHAQIEIVQFVGGG
ncbi:MAG: sulfur carrier protein ThiS [Bryobacteraceae bacterium]